MGHERTVLPGSKTTRSRNGCTSCRRAKVRCSQSLPICQRCSRLSLSCERVLHPTPLKERRRGCGPWKNREGWAPQQLLPRPSKSCDLEIRLGDDNTSVGKMHHYVSKPTDLLTAQRRSSGNLLHQHDPVSPVTDGYGDNVQDVSDDAILFLSESPCVPRPSETYADFPLTYDDTPLSNWSSDPAPPSESSSPNAHIPSPVVLNDAERNAIEYYQNVLSKAHFTKNPRWSTMAAFRRVASTEPVIMHLLLALSLGKQAGFAQDRERLWSLAQKNFEIGTQKLTEMLQDETSLDHCVIMIAFWLLYFLYHTGSDAVGLQKIQKLSVTVASYARKFGLLDLYSMNNSALATPLQRQTAPTCPRERSLLARVMVWIFYYDVYSSFLSGGGSLGALLNENEKEADTMFKASQSALQLFFGSEYPAGECPDDIENSMALELYYKITMIVQEISSTSPGGMLDDQQHKQMEDKLEVLEGFIFRLSAESSASQPRVLENIYWTVSHFHGARILNYRRLVDTSSGKCPTTVQVSVSSVLHIAQRAQALNGTDVTQRLQWPHFMAGLETLDPIHHEWILGKLPPGRLHNVLEMVIKSHSSQKGGGRISLDEALGIYCGHDESLKMSLIM